VAYLKHDDFNVSRPALEELRRRATMDPSLVRRIAECFAHAMRVEQDLASLMSCAQESLRKQESFRKTETPKAPAALGRGTPAKQAPLGGFRMRIESVADMLDCVMVAGPVETGNVRVGTRVAIVHGNERLEGRIKDSTSMGGRQAYVLDGIPGNAIQKGDMLVEA
jgi:hypothetical protein